MNLGANDSILEVLLEDVKYAPNGREAEEIARSTGKGYSTLMNELNPSLLTHKFGLLQLIPLMEATGSTRALDYLCGAMGCVCIRMPKSCTNHLTTERDAMEAVKQFGELMVAVGDGLDDGKLTHDECRRIRGEGYEAIQAIMTLIHKLD